MNRFWKFFCIAIIGICLGISPYLIFAQSENPSSPPAAKDSSKASLTAKLVDKEKKAKEKAATVEVTVTGVQLVDPAQSGEKPVAGQGHLHYKVDDGPIVATTAAKLSFHELSKGSHKITVMLAANDHSPLGPQEVLTVDIP